MPTRPSTSSTARHPDGTVTGGRPDGTSAPTHAGRLLGIQKTGDNPINVIPPMGANSSWQLINESRLRQGIRIPGIGDRFYDLRMDVRIRPSGWPICTASIDGDSTRTTCENNGIKPWKPTDSDTRPYPGWGSNDDPKWKKLTGGR